ncbi:MAG: phosphoenolpyruvate carboxykinase, partial [Micrococcales bacterium]|nr:phosphoenolpyruvate carboxykinase [Micrococcales bacterium]
MTHTNPVPAVPPAPAGPGHPRLQAWIAEVAQMTTPKDIVWVTGSDAQRQALTEQLVDAGTLIRLNPELRPNSFLARSDPSDVARVESRTYIASRDKADAGPTNNWREPTELRAELKEV